MLNAASTGLSVMNSAATSAFIGGSFMYKLTHTLIKFWNYDFFDPEAFPVNVFGARLWTLVIFASLMQNALNTSKHLGTTQGLSSSDFMQIVVFQGILVHCTYKILQYISGAWWNWGKLWVYVVVTITLPVYSYLHNHDDMRSLTLTSHTSDLTQKQKNVLYACFGSLALWALLNIVGIVTKRRTSFKYPSIKVISKRVLWLCVVIITIALHIHETDAKWHYHHALIAWAAFCIAIMFGTLPGWPSVINQFAATISLSVMIHGGTLYGISDYQLLIDDTDTQPKESHRNMYVACFIGAIVLLSIRFPKHKASSWDRVPQVASVAPLATSLKL